MDLVQQLPWWLRLVLGAQVLGAGYIYHALGKYNAQLRPLVHTETSSGVLPIHKKLPAHRNPFVNHTWKMPLYERLKIALMCVTLTPLRILGLLVTLCGCSLWCRLLLLCRRGPALSATHRAIFAMTIPLFSRGVALCFGYHRLPCRGRAAPPNEAPILVASHCSIADFFLIVAVHGPTIVVAEQSNVKNPILGPIMEAMEAIMLDRFDATSREAAKNAITAHATATVAGESSKQISVFPEGATCSADFLIAFKQGAFIPGVPVQGLCINYKFRHFDPSWCFSGPGAWFLTLRMMAQFYNQAELVYTDVVTPTEEERANPSHFAETVRKAMGRVGGFELTGHSGDDVVLQAAALKFALPPEVGAVGAEDIKNFFHVDRDTIKKHLEVFAKIDKDKSGSCSFEEFLEAGENVMGSMGASQKQRLGALFQLLHHGTGEINFREYLLGLGLVSESTSVGVAQMAFTLLDMDGDGKVTFSDLCWAIGWGNEGKSSTGDTSPRSKEVAALWDPKSEFTEEQFVEFCGNHSRFLELLQDKFYETIPESKPKVPTVADALD